TKTAAAARWTRAYETHRSRVSGNRTASAMTARVTGIHGSICWSADLTAPASGTGSPPMTLEPNDVCAPHSTPTMNQRTQTDSASRAFIRGGAERRDGAEKRWLLLAGTACCRVNCLDCHPDQRQRRGISSAVLVAGPRVTLAGSLVAFGSSG